MSTNRGETQKHTDLVLEGAPPEVGHLKTDKAFEDYSTLNIPKHPIYYHKFEISTIKLHAPY